MEHLHEDDVPRELLQEDLRGKAPFGSEAAYLGKIVYVQALASPHKNLYTTSTCFPRLRTQTQTENSLSLQTCGRIRICLNHDDNDDVCPRHTNDPMRKNENPTETQCNSAPLILVVSCNDGSDGALLLPPRSELTGRTLVGGAERRLETEGAAYLGKIVYSNLVKTVL